MPQMYGRLMVMVLVALVEKITYRKIKLGNKIDKYRFLIYYKHYAIRTTILSNY